MHFNLQVQHDISRCQVLTSLGKDALCKTGCLALHETVTCQWQDFKVGSVRHQKADRGMQGTSEGFHVYPLHPSDASCIMLEEMNESTGHLYI
jgi:hypothetical protein